MDFSDRNWFGSAVVVYGISTVYSIFLFRKGFRRDNLINYALLFSAFCLHTAAMALRGFSLQRCPINNLYEATIFLNWTMVAAYLPIGIWVRFRHLGAFAAPILFALGVFALMPGLDTPATTPSFTGGWASLHKALILLAYGAFGLSCVAGLMFLSQEYNLKHNKTQAIFSLMPPIQRLENILGQLMVIGFALLTFGLVASFIHLKQSYGYYFKLDAIILYSLLVWILYAALLVLRWCYAQRGRRLAWGAIVTFIFVMLTFWGIYMISHMHNPESRAPRIPERTPALAVDRGPSGEPAETRRAG